jgi:hypothetical protein
LEWAERKDNGNDSGNGGRVLRFDGEAIVSVSVFFAGFGQTFY